MGDALLKARYLESLMAISVVFKDIKLGRFLDRDIIGRAPISSTQKKLVYMIYALDVASRSPPQ